ncbi:MAG: YraN family protein [Burkholderiaceae bacterium]
MDDRHRREAGISGEDAALAHLKAHGLKLITRNYRCRAGELDLVMLENSTLVLVEVRYRATADYGGAAASVTWRKQRRIAMAARHLLLTRADLRRYPARFDVVAISPEPHGVRIDWIKRAFTL